jgi:hypothetical protein
MSEADEEREVPEFESGRQFFPAAWSQAANDGLISNEEYVEELIRHTRAENKRTMPGVPWPDDEDDEPCDHFCQQPPKRWGSCLLRRLLIGINRHLGDCSLPKD